jgi:hypothetical protein
MTRPTLFEDVQAIVDAAKAAGDVQVDRMAAANAKYLALVKERKLLHWETHVLKEKVLSALRDAKLIEQNIFDSATSKLAPKITGEVQTPLNHVVQPWPCKTLAPETQAVADTTLPNADAAPTPEGEALPSTVSQG